MTKKKMHCKNVDLRGGREAEKSEILERSAKSEAKEVSRTDIGLGC